MVQYRDLRPTRPEDSMRKLLRRIDKGSTVPHGQKVAEAGEGTTYLDESGASWRWDGDVVREYDARISAGQEAIAEAEAALEQAKADLEAAQGRIDATTEELEALAERVTDAAEEVEGARARLGEVESRLDATAQDLAGLEGRADAVDSAVSRIDSTATAADRKASTAQTAAEAAKTDAATAQARADAANSKALEAAGIAAGKGKIIYQATAPTGANAAKENLWVRASDSKVHAYDGSKWVEITDPIATKAAQDAVKAAQDAAAAKTAADAAKARADQAVTDAAAAKAQADKALSDAAAATTKYNELAKKLDAALAGAQQVFKDPSFEDPERWAHANVGAGGGQVTDQVRTGAQAVKYMASTSTGFTYPATKEGRYPVSPGQTYRLTVYVRANSLPSNLDTFRFIASSQAGVVSALRSYTPLQTWGVATSRAWTRVQWDWTIPDTGWSEARFGFQLQNPTTDLWFDDFQVVDVTEQLSLIAQVEAAKKAAQDAAVGANDALRRANEAITSANGKSTVRFTTTLGKPSIVGTAAGDTVFVQGAGGVIVEIWRWDGSDWAAAPVGHETIASIDLGKATVGYLDVAQRVRAGAISADKLLIGIGDNVVLNGDARAPEGWAEFGRNGAGGATNNGYPGSFWILGRLTKNSDVFPINRTGTHRVEYWIKGTTPGAKHYVQIQTVSSNGSSTTNPYVTSNADVPGDGSWRKYAGTVEIPPGVTGIQFRLYAQHTNGTTDPTAYTWVTGVSIREMTGGDMVVNGAITGDHVDANSVAAKVGQFVKVQAVNVEVTGDLSGRVAQFLSTESKKLIVTEETILNHTTLLGDTVAERLNITKKLKGRDAIFDGTVDIEQLNVTGPMAAEIVLAMSTQTKELIVTGDAILKRATVIESLMTPELITERIKVKELAAEMMTSGGLQTSTAANRGVKISEAGIKAWDASGNQVMDLNGSDNYIVGSISTARQGQGRLFLESYTDSITGVRSGKLDVYPTSGVVDHGVLRMDSRSQTMSLSVHSYGAQPTALLDDGGIGISKDRTSVVGNLAMWGGFVGGNALQLARFDGSSIPAGGSMEFVIGFSGIPNGFTATVFPMLQNANNQPVTCVFHSVTQNSVKGWIRNLGGSATGQQWNRFMIISAKF